MHKEGFRYTLYAKGLYYDGHDCPNVIKYCQNLFLTMMKKHKEQLVKYVVGMWIRRLSQNLKIVLNEG